MSEEGQGNTPANTQTTGCHCSGVWGPSLLAHLRQFFPVTHYVLSSWTFSLWIWTAETWPGPIPLESAQMVTKSENFLIILSRINLGSCQFLSALTDRAISTLLKASAPTSPGLGELPTCWKNRKTHNWKTVRSPYGSEILQACAHILLGNSAFPAGIPWKWGHPHSQRYRSKSQAAWLGFTPCSLWLLKKIIRRHRKKASVKALARSRQTRVPRGEGGDETHHTTPPKQNTHFHLSYTLGF